LSYRPTLATASALVLAFALAACGSSASTATHTVTILQGTTATPPGPIASEEPLDSAPAAAVAPATPISAFKRCDTNITAKKHTTTCAFAENVFYEYWRAGGAQSIRAYSPATAKSYRLSCEHARSGVTCSAGDGAIAKFSIASVDQYTSAQARAFADSHDVGATPTPTSTPPTATPQPAAPAPVDPPVATDISPDFCANHNCIPNYPNGNGSTVQCSDGSYSHSGGVQGACSHHGGVG
jgi:hypothetical protein